MVAARRVRSAPALLGLVLLCAAALLSTACAGSRAAGCGCEPATACGACATADPCGPCGPRPAEAKCGEAWCCVWVPPIEGQECYQCLVCPAKERCVWVPPAFGTRPKLVCRTPAALTERIQPAVWAQHKRDVLVCPERESVRPICCPPGELAPCEKQCGCVTKCCHPAVWGEVCERVCLECERRCVGFKPAEYVCVEETYEISPGFTQKVCEPAVYETRTRKVCAQPGRWEWRKNDNCKPPPDLVALQLEMVDSAPDGTPAGMFKVGSQARFDLKVTAEVGSAPMKGLFVVFTLPPEYEFASGSSTDGVTITGSGQSARTSAFDLAGERQVKLFVLVNVKAAPKKETAVFSAAVRDASGMDLAVETEESTIPSVP
jgi:hypothetical protein